MPVDIGNTRERQGLSVGGGTLGVAVQNHEKSIAIGKPVISVITVGNSVDG